MKVYVLIIATLVSAALASNDTIDTTATADSIDSDDSDEPETANSEEPIKLPRIISRITNGYLAYNGKAPYTVALILSDRSGAWLCGGSIIGHNWVLTAAHCVDEADRVAIHYGSNLRTRPAYTHEVERSNFIQHPSNDIALIRTPHVDFWHMVNKVVLPSFNDRNNQYTNWWAVACGWGGTHENNGLPEWLQCVDLQIISNNECSRTFNINDAIICVSTPGGRSTCGGDSGGPLVTHDGNILVGITAFGSAAGCTSGAPAAFTRVSPHLDWIRSHTGIAY